MKQGRKKRDGGRALQRGRREKREEEKILSFADDERQTRGRNDTHQASFFGAFSERQNEGGSAPVNNCPLLGPFATIYATRSIVFYSSCFSSMYLPPTLSILSKSSTAQW